MNILKFSAFLLMGLTFFGCNFPESVINENNSGEENINEEIIVMLSNPSDQPIEVRFFDHEGWSYKKRVTANAIDTIKIIADTFRIASKLDNGEYLTTYPDQGDLSYVQKYSNFGLDINPETGDTSLAFVFKKNPYTTKDGGYPGMYFIDLTHDTSNLYAIGEARWLYGAEALNTAEDFEQAALKSQKEGYPITHSAFTGGGVPRIIPKHTLSFNAEFPESINVSYNSKGSVLKLYKIPNEQKKNIQNYVFNAIMKENL